MGRPFLPGRREMCSLNLNRLPPDEQDWVYERMIPVSACEAFEVIFTGVPIDATRVHTPMLVINGGSDRLTPPGVGRSIARKYGATYLEYADHAHYLMWEPRWEVVAADIDRWLGQTVRI
jgi:pimeloyl-ACP methyl ester carboxylesterase